MNSQRSRNRKGVAIPAALFAAGVVVWGLAGSKAFVGSDAADELLAMSFPERAVQLYNRTAALPVQDFTEIPPCTLPQIRDEFAAGLRAAAERVSAQYRLVVFASAVTGACWLGAAMWTLYVVWNHNNHRGRLAAPRVGSRPQRPAGHSPSLALRMPSWA